MRKDNPVTGVVVERKTSDKQPFHSAAACLECHVYYGKGSPGATPVVCIDSIGRDGKAKATLLMSPEAADALAMMIVHVAERARAAAEAAP
ncbi:MAG: hypothetical protein U1E43_07720 [Rhodospirillales bacterium]